MAVDGQTKYISYTNCSNNRQLQKKTSCFSMPFQESEWPWLCVFSFHWLKTIIKPWNSMTLIMCIYFHSLGTLIEPWSLATYHITQKRARAHTHTHTHTHIHTKWKEVGEEYLCTSWAAVKRTSLEVCVGSSWTWASVVSLSDIVAKSLFFNTISSSSSSSSSSCRYNAQRGTFKGKKINLEKPHSLTKP